MWNRRSADAVHRFNRVAARTRRPGRVRMLIVREQGAPAALTVPHARLHAGIASAVVGIVAFALFVGDYVALRRAWIESATYVERLNDQEQMNTRLRASLDKVRREMEAWPRLQAAIGEPFDRLPAPAPPAVAADDTDPTVRAVRHGTTTLKQTADLMTRVREAVAPLPTRWPVRAAINSHFGQRRSPWSEGTEFHTGVDIAAAHGSEVVAPAPGSVVFTGHHGAYGLTVKVQHAEGLETLYGHLSKVSVRQGDRVTRGQAIGRAGNTGRSTGSHLHYEVLVAGRAVNPKAYLWD